jgi:hypothetical protein
MFKFNKLCPFCGQDHEYNFDVSYEQAEEWYTNRNALIQHVMPDLPPDEREVFITGMCFDCQSRIFQ